jgi:hypothetical protein
MLLNVTRAVFGVVLMSPVPLMKALLETESVSVNIARALVPIAAASSAGMMIAAASFSAMIGLLSSLSVSVSDRVTG